jgi:predicted glycoside hydrolase/deacetylase ChbG (UPF0249 family)
MNKSPTAAEVGAGLRGVIVCADDFAVHQSASLGIAKLANMGRISATSAMVLSPRWAQDVALLHELRGQIAVGLHLDWTSDFAVAAGHGLPLGQAMRRALLGGFNQAQSSSVIERQLDLFEAQWQAPPDYVDGHQHVQQFAGIRQALVAVLARRYSTQAAKPYLRISRAPPDLADLKSRVIAWMGANAIEKIATSQGVTMARSLFGIYNFEGDAPRYAALMTHWLAHAPARAILMCHPAQAAEPGDEIGAARAREFAYLSSPEFARALAAAKVQVVRGRVCL